MLREKGDPLGKSTHLYTMCVCLGQDPPFLVWKHAYGLVSSSNNYLVIS